MAAKREEYLLDGQKGAGENGLDDGMVVDIDG